MFTYAVMEYITITFSIKHQTIKQFYVPSYNYIYTFKNDTPSIVKRLKNIRSFIHPFAHPII